MDEKGEQNRTGDDWTFVGALFAFLRLLCCALRLTLHHVNLSRSFLVSFFLFVRLSCVNARSLKMEQPWSTSS